MTEEIVDEFRPLRFESLERLREWLIEGTSSGDRISDSVLLGRNEIAEGVRCLLAAGCGRSVPTD